MTILTRPRTALLAGVAVLCGAAIAMPVTSIRAAAAAKKCSAGNPVQTVAVPTDEQPVVHPLLNNKTNHSGVDFSSRLAGLIKGAPCGASIEISVFTFGKNTTVNRKISGALISAVRRGVRVNVILDSKNAAKDRQGKQLHAAIHKVTAAHKHNPSAYHSCGPCISHASGGVDHNKFATFSQTGSDVNVVFQTSANFEQTGSGDADWNSGLIVVDGDPTDAPPATLYGAYRAYFSDLVKIGAKSASADADYFHNRPTVVSATDAATHSALINAPEALVGGTSDAGDDFVIQTLGEADCSAGAHVYVVDSGWQSDRAVAIVKELNSLEVAGCKVVVIAGGQDTNDYSAFHALVHFSASDAPSDPKPPTTHMRVYYLCGPTKHPKGSHYANSHNKYWILSSAGGQPTVFDGSENFSAQSLNKSDQGVIDLQDQHSYNAFKHQVQEMITPAKVNKLSPTGLIELAPDHKLWGSAAKARKTLQGMSCGASNVVTAS